MIAKPTWNQLLWRAALTGTATVIVVAACDLAESRLGIQCPWAAKASILFALFALATWIPFRQPSEGMEAGKRKNPHSQSTAP